MNLIPKSCFFTGHRMIYSDRDKLLSCLREEILNKINDGVTTFIAGGAIGFDTMAAEQVIDMRSDYPIRLLLYLPCIDQNMRWHTKDKLKFEKILDCADRVFYITEGEYEAGCMKKRNSAMVDASDCGIVYLKKSIRSGSAQTIKMAREKGIDVVNIAEKWDI